MTPTTQLRVLRTSFAACTITLPIRAAYLVPPQTRAFATSLCLRTAKKQAVSTVAQYNSGTHSRTSRSSSTPTASATLSPTAANPPATTRPPPLELPTRTPETSTISHLFHTGKAYLTFYKTGLKNVYLNTRLVWSLNAAGGIPTDSSSSTVVARPPVKRVPEHGGTTRAGLILRRRWSHDIRRLPLFALILLICGEFTPVVVLALPGAVPFTCRIPRQVEALLAKTEERRRRSFAQLAEAAQRIQGQQQVPTKDKKAIAHISRSLNLVSPLWDTMGVPDVIVGSYVLAGRKVRAHLAFLEEDTRLLRQAGGVDALEDAEVVLACADRGIDIMGAEVSQLRSQLRSWVKEARTGPADVSGDRIATLLTSK